MSTRAMGALMLLIGACSMIACHQTMHAPPGMRGVDVVPPGEMDLRREYWDGGSAPTQLRSETEVLVAQGGAFVKHGRERGFDRSGAVLFERHWVQGKPARVWRAWWQNGGLRSQCEFTSDHSSSDMFFWHENGELEARGPAIHGRRIGHWEFFHDDGSKESAGHFQDGTREGDWMFWDACERIVELRRYERGVQIDSTAASTAPNR